MKLAQLASAALLALCTATSAQSAVVIEAYDSGSNLIFDLSGSLDLTGMPGPGTTFSTGTAIVPNSGLLLLGGSGPNMDLYTGGLFPSFGTGGAAVFTATHSGDQFSVFFGGQIGITAGYVSGSALSGQTIISGQSLASTGMTIGSYTINLPSDTVTLQVGAATVPLPAAGALLLTALGGLGVARRRRRG